MFRGKGKFKASGSRESLDGNLSSPYTSNENLSESTGTGHHTPSFEASFLGMVHDVNLGGQQLRDPDVQLIDKVEEAQLESKVRLVAKEEDMVSISITKHGLKVLDKNKKEVLQRHPLHTVSQAVYYMDSFFKHNVVFKIGNVGRKVYNCYVFQCNTEEQAQQVCQKLKAVFDAVTNGS